MHQGNPVPLVGDVFTKDDFRYFRQTAAGYRIDSGAIILPSQTTEFAICDLAISKRSTADWTVIGVFAQTAKGDLLLLDRMRPGSLARRVGARIVGVPFRQNGTTKPMCCRMRAPR